MVLGFDSLSLNRKRLYVGLIGLTSEVYDCRLLYVKCRTTSSLLIEGVPNDSFDAFPVALRRRSRDPRCEVVHEGYRTTMAVDSSLY